MDDLCFGRFALPAVHGFALENPTSCFLPIPSPAIIMACLCFPQPPLLTQLPKATLSILEAVLARGSPGVNHHVLRSLYSLAVIRYAFCSQHLRRQQLATMPIVSRLHTINCESKVALSASFVCVCTCARVCVSVVGVELVLAL